MAYTFDVDLDPAGSVGERIAEATGQVAEAEHATAEQLADATELAAQKLAELAPEAKGRSVKRTLSVVGHVGDGAAKLAVAVRVG